MFFVFPGNPKRISSRRGLNEVNCGRAIKRKKKLALDFLTKIHPEDRFFIIEIRFCFSFLLQNLYFEILIQIYQSGKFSY